MLSLSSVFGIKGANVSNVTIMHFVIHHVEHMLFSIGLNDFCLIVLNFVMFRTSFGVWNLAA